MNDQLRSSREIARAEILVAGAVQGVGYRHFACGAAETLGVVGYAMNRSDGRVEVVAEGDRAAIEQLVRELEWGPRAARVDSVHVTWGEPRGEFDAFGVRYAGRNA